ncbi:MAG TPA: TonB-dependent receptor [Candidatus Cryosericum sp.]|nr:TonB-dependent receptor [Candidatus Cryosericum sp.]
MRFSQDSAIDRVFSAIARTGRSAPVVIALFAALVPVPPVLAQQAVSGAIRGTVSDKDFDVPLAQVRVTLLEAFLSTQSGTDGTFLFERVPPGTYTLAFTKDGYQRQVVPEVVVNAGGLTEIRTRLSLEVTEMEEVVVTGQDLLGDTEVGLLDIRADAAMVQDAISSEIMTKSGATDVAGALKFVVGASVAQGKYATVRGLSDRYTGTTLNHVRIPSADPRRRAVQVDLFPTGTIENVTVTKTFTPDLEGDFTGGGIDIQTKSIPEEGLFSTSFGVEYNSQATGNEDFLTYEGGGVEFLGIAGSDRALPEEARHDLPVLPTPKPAALTPQEIQNGETWDRFIRSFDPVMGVSHEAPGPNYSFSVVGGDRFDQGEGKTVGLLGALTYTHKYDFYEGGQNNTYAVSDPSQPLILGQPQLDSAGLDEVLVGLLGSFVYQASPQHEYGFRLVANQSAEDVSRFQTSGDTLVQQNQALHYTERTVASGQLHGKHAWPEVGFKELRLEWYAAYNITGQDEPDVRFFRNTFDTTRMEFLKPSNLNDADITRRIFRNVGEAGPQAAVDLTLPFDQWTKLEGRIKAGAFYDQTDRDYTQDTFVYHFVTAPAANAAIVANNEYAKYTATRPGELWTDVFLNPERIGLAMNRCQPPNQAVNLRTVNPPCAAHNQLLWYLDPQPAIDVDYTGDQSVSALYAMGDLPLSPSVRVIGGARYEKTEMLVQPENDKNRIELIELQPSGGHTIVAATNAEAEAEIDEASILPSLGVVYEIVPQMNLRASWGRTLARPTFRELSPVATEEFLAGDEFVGNVDLALSSITNYDLRWEWFRKPGEVLAASLFYKELTDPIELVSFVTSGRNFVQPVNYERGEVRGAEIEARLPLGGFAEALEGLAVGANYTVIDSEVDVPEVEQQGLTKYGLDEPTRRLQGQPENLFNASLSYDSERFGISTGLFYNVLGETLVTGAAAGESGGVPNAFETSYRTLDFTYSQKLVRGTTDLSLTLKAKNILQPERESVYRSPDGQEVIKTLRDTALLYGLSFALKW